MAGALEAGIRNMLVGCAGLQPGQSLLIVTEDPPGRYYDPALADAVVGVAYAMGLTVSHLALPVPAIPAPPPPDAMAAIVAADRTVFLSRRGDQLRFDGAMAEASPVMCYALDRDMMASGFGRAPHAAFIALRDCINAAMAQAQRIQVTCPLGTDFNGPGARFPEQGADVTVRRFPLSVFTPVPAGAYAGRLALAGFLTGTGRCGYEPYTLPLDGVLEIDFEGTRITGFSGPDAGRAAAHFRQVGALTGTDAERMHSWHAGIHPGCGWPTEAAEDVARWSGGAFGNPRVLHFHACGSTPPGEISLNVIDATVRLDGVALWEAGRLRPERIPDGAAILAQYPAVAALFAAPAQAVGLAPTGRLAARPVSARATG